ncbi:hypothetical protein Tco_0979571, partial [Tanacetum coccineum]
MKASIQGKDNAIKKLRMQISQLKETRSEADRTLDFRTLDFHITQLTEKVTILQEQNELFRAENEKVKQHYKELYDSIKITRAKHIEQTTALLTENENLKVQIQNKMKCVTKDHVKPKVLAPGRYAIDVEPIPPRNRNNREVHLDYLKHLKESVETLREIVEEAKVERPFDRSLASACLYTKHSHELLEYVIGTCPKDFHPRDTKHAATPLTRKKLTKSKVVPAKQTEDVSTSKTVITRKLSHTFQKPLTSYQRKNQPYQAVPGSISTPPENKAIAYANQLDPNQKWGSNFPNSPSSSVFKCRNFVKKYIGTVRFRNDNFGAIMGYGDYVIGDSVISRVYYVEGLGHNLFSFGHDEVLPNLLVVQSLQEQIMVMASSFKPLELR